MNKLKIEKKLAVPVDGLKFLGAVSMLIDHIGAVFFPDIIFLRLIGRFAFPIFAFLLVEGFYRSRDYMEYGVRLSILFLISQIPSWLLFHHLEFNVIFTFAYALLLLILFEKLPFDVVLISLAGSTIFIPFSATFAFEFGFYGLWLPLFYYAVRRSHKKNVLAFSSCWSLAHLAVIPYSIIQFFNPGLYLIFIEPVYGRRYLPKYFFYIFYPAHLIILYCLQLILWYINS